MNATIIVAASSILLACVAFAFFMLQGGSDELAGAPSGKMTFSGPETDFVMSWQQESHKSTLYIEDGDGVNTAIWVKKFIEGEYEDEATLLAEGVTYHVVEFANGVATSCRENMKRDMDRINHLTDSMKFDGNSTYTITEDDFEGESVELQVTASIEDVVIPQFDWSTCLEIGDPINPFVANDGSRKTAEEKMTIYERALAGGAENYCADGTCTTSSNLAQSVYSDAKCYSTTTVASGGLHLTKGPCKALIGAAFSDPSTACYKRTDTEDGYCNFAFRGSDDKNDWLDNICGALENDKSMPDHTGYGSLKVHAGFYNQFKTLHDNGLGTDVQAAIGSGCKVRFIGHSLGGAIANVAHKYYNTGEINTYAGASPYKGGEPSGRRSESKTRKVWGWCDGGWWPDYPCRKDQHYTKHSTVYKNKHVTGKRVYHESDPVPYAANIMGFDHGGGTSYKIAYTPDRNCYTGDYCSSKYGNWRLYTMGANSNLPKVPGSKVFLDVVKNIISISKGTSHFHSMNAYYQPMGV